MQVTYVKGFGKLASPTSVSVDLNGGGQEVIQAKNIILAVGSEVTPLSTCPVDNASKSGRGGYECMGGMSGDGMIW